MGGRKKAQKVVKKKKRIQVPTQFKCIFCSTENSVSVKLDFATMLGELKCKYCNEKFQSRIHNLSDPIDVYSEWFDEALKKQDEENRNLTGKAGVPGNDEDDDAEEGGFGEEEEEEGEDVEDDR